MQYDGRRQGRPTHRQLTTQAPDEGATTSGPGRESTTVAERSLTLLAALLAAGAAVAALQGWRQLTIALLVVAAGAAAARAAATQAGRWLYTVLAIGALVVAGALVGTQPAEPSTAADGGSAAPSSSATPLPERSTPRVAEGGDREGEAEADCRVAGEPSPCAIDGAVLVSRQVEECSPAGVTRRWGLEPGLDALLIETLVSADGRECWISPALAARTAGASALDVERAREGQVSPSLRACARRDGTETVSCSERHELEFVGQWQELPPVDVDDVCKTAAVRYTGTTLAGAQQVLESLVLRGEVVTGEQWFRCAVASDRTLDGSVRSIGGADLPIASE